MTKVDVKPVLRLIKYHSEGDFEEAKKAAIEIAQDLELQGKDELCLYILAQYGLTPTWVPQ